MQEVLLVIHLMLALAIIALVLLQQSEGGGLGIGGGGGMGGLATARGTANLLTRLTTIFAIIFMCTSLGLAVLAKKQNAAQPDSILDLANEAEVTVPLVADEATAIEEKVEDVKESVKEDVKPPSPKDTNDDVSVPLSE
jgi:preprotein translocase subunit SecG